MGLGFRVVSAWKFRVVLIIRSEWFYIGYIELIQDIHIYLYTFIYIGVSYSLFSGLAWESKQPPTRALRACLGVQTAINRASGRRGLRGPLQYVESLGILLRHCMRFGPFLVCPDLPNTWEQSFLQGLNRVCHRDGQVSWLRYEGLGLGKE